MRSVVSIEIALAQFANFWPKPTLTITSYQGRNQGGRGHAHAKPKCLCRFLPSSPNFLSGTSHFSHPHFSNILILRITMDKNFAFFCLPEELWGSKICQNAFSVGAPPGPRWESTWCSPDAAEKAIPPDRSHSTPQLSCRGRLSLVSSAQVWCLFTAALGLATAWL